MSRNVFISGSTSGVGLGIARAFKAEGCQMAAAALASCSSSVLLQGHEVIEGVDPVEFARVD